MTSMFVTRNDILKPLLRIETMHDIEYVSEAYHNDEQIPTYSSVIDIPNIGIATFANFVMTNSYLIMQKNDIYHIDIVHSIGSPRSIKYHACLQKNLDLITFASGGFYAHKEFDVFIGSSVGYFRGATDKAKELYRPYGKYLTRSFVTIKDWRNRPWKVGPEALELLRNGMRFITDNDIYDHPDYRHHDLQLPEKYK